MQRYGPVVMLSGLLLAGCGSGGSTDASTAQGAATQSARSAPAPEAQSARPAPATTAVSCPAVARPRFAWPSPVPSELPQPAGSTFTSTTRRDTLTLVRFSSPHSLQQSVAFVLHALPASGFAVGRGDAEGAEADAPFTKGEVRGVLKMQVAGPCMTQWLLEVTRAKLPGRGSAVQPAPAYQPGSTSPPSPFR